MKKKNILIYLVIFNLFVLLIILLGKIPILKEFIKVIFSVVVIPIIFGVFLFYILKPLNRLFIRKKMKRGTAASLTIFIFLFVLAGVIKYFSDYFIAQFMSIKSIFMQIIESRSDIEDVKNIVKGTILNVDYYHKFLGDIQNYIFILANNIRNFFEKGMQLFSDILLVILIVFYLLKDEEKIKDSIVNMFPKKYKDKVYNIV